jgi:DNA topoisomerase I
MRMNIGWRGESYRHYLASKGVKSTAIKYKKAPAGANYEFYGVDQKGRRVRLYGKRHVEQQKAKKFRRVRILRKKMSMIEEGIKRDTEAKDEEKRENARVAYIILKTGLRPGSSKDTKAEQQAYGVTTLQKNQVKFSDGDATFDFIGKKGVHIIKKVHDPMLVRILKQQKNGEGKELFPNASDATVRRYLRKYGNVKTKDLRTLRANEIAEKLSKKGVGEKKIYEGVAKELNNTPGVSKSAYVDVEVL